MMNEHPEAQSAPDDMPFRGFAITDENRSAVFDLAIGCYVGEACAECGCKYDSVADIKERDPKRGYGAGFTLVDSACWEAHIARHKDAR